MCLTKSLANSIGSKGGFEKSPGRERFDQPDTGVPLIKLGAGDPPSIIGIITGGEVAPDRLHQEIPNDVRVARRSGPTDCSHLTDHSDRNPGLLAHLAHDRIECFLVALDTTTGQGPLPPRGFRAALDQQDALSVVDADRADTRDIDHGSGRWMEGASS